MIKPYNILDAREHRANLQEELLSKYNLPLLAIRTNYPGLDKNNKYSQYISKTIFEYIKLKLNSKIKNIEIIDSYEGLVYLISVDINSIKLKKIMIEIETYHNLGRLVDLDVLTILDKKDLNNNSLTLSRTELGFSPRTCFICNDVAHICVRSQKHSLGELLEFIHYKVDKFKVKNTEGEKDV